MGQKPTLFDEKKDFEGLDKMEAAGVFLFLYKSRDWLRSYSSKL